MHQSSLERIEFVGNIYPEDDGIWTFEHDKIVSNRDGVRLLSENDPTQSETLFTQLASIDFSGPDRYTTCEALMTWLILNAPNLKAITLAHSYLTPGIADAMMKSDHFSKLKIVRTRGDRDSAGITEFLESHIAKAGQSSLEEMTLSMDKWIYGATWLPLIFRLKCLNTLELLVFTILDDARPTLVALGQGCPALENLTLGAKYATFADGLIQPLTRLPKLKCLRIGARSLSDNDLFALGGFPKLERLYLQYKCSDFTMRILRKQIQKVVIE